MNAKTLARMAVLTALALVLGYIEHFFVLVPAVPGIKLGLSNTVLLYAIYMISKRGALVLMLLKVFLSGLLFAGFTATIFSLSGGALSLLCMVLAHRIKGFSVVGVSIAGAVAHNVGQTVAACFYVNTMAMVAYLPLLLISGVVTGLLTGTAAKYTINGLRLNKVSKDRKEEPNVKKHLPAFIALFIITALAGLFLGLTNEITKTPIKEQEDAAAVQSRQAVFPEATEFEPVELSEDSPMSAVFAAKSSGGTLGYVAFTTVKGYGGEIEIVLGMNNDGIMTGVNIGGTNFAETAGLGARAKEPWFAAQFVEKTAPFEIGENVDAITNATITSGSVIAGINKAAEYLNNTYIAPVETASPIEIAMPGVTEFTEQTALPGTDAIWTCENGCVIQLSVAGYNGRIQVTAGIAKDGTITGLHVGGPLFAETPALGGKTTEPAFTGQFVGKTGTFTVGDNIDAVSGATISSKAVTDAVNKAQEIAKEVMK